MLCDHASNRLPLGFGGVPEDVLSDHYGWDIGALGVARVVAHELAVGLVRSNFSRLVIDPNRGLEADDLIRQDLGLEMNARIGNARIGNARIGNAHTGNARIGDAEKRRRIALFYEPYHRAIDDLLDADEAIVGVIAIHTFTPMLEGVRRKWEAGLIYDTGRAADAVCASFLIENLRNPNNLCNPSNGFCVGDNEPYPILAGDSLMRHGGERGLVGVGIEVRNDLVRTQATQEAWGRRLARALRGWMEKVAS